MTPFRSELSRVLATAPACLPGWSTPEFWEDAAAEGVLPLMVAAASAAEWEGVPAELRAHALRQARDEAARAALSERDLRRVLGAFCARGIPALLLKGTALGYTHYGGLSNRPRVDVDLLIRRDDIERVHDVFRSLGAEYVPHVTGRYVMSQFHYATTDDAGCRHTYDVHWRIVNGHRFANALRFDDLSTAATTVPALASVGARVPSPAHSLLLACLHRATHHAASGPLIWLYDIHLLAERLDPPGREAVVSIAAERQLAAVAAHSLRESAAAFNGPVTAALASELHSRAAAGEDIARYLATRGNRARGLVDDLGALDGWRPRLTLVREVLFPPAAYMRNGYAPGSDAPLALLYLRRAARGVAGFFGMSPGQP